MAKLFNILLFSVLGVLFLIFIVGVIISIQPDAEGSDTSSTEEAFNLSSVGKTNAVQFYATYKKAIAAKDYILADSMKKTLMQSDYINYPESDSVVTHWAIFTNEYPEARDAVAAKERDEKEKAAAAARAELVSEAKSILSAFNKILTNGVPEQDRFSELELLAKWTDEINAAKSLNDRELNKLIKEVEPKLSRHKAKRFPIIRREFAAELKKKFWRENIDVEIKGKNFSTLTLTGGVFASNANKQDFQTEVSQVLHKMRFKRVEYKWYEYDDEYTYYTLKSPADTN